MNKLFATIVLAAFALSSCIKEDDSYEKMKPVIPGINIWNMTMTQNSVAMQPANAGIRLALLLAEAGEQFPSKDLKDIKLDELKVDNIVIQNILFNSGVKIERQENGDYLITYSKNYQLPDGYFLDGTMRVKTNGVEQLKDTQMGTPWQVEMGSELKLLVSTDYGIQTVNMEGGTTMLFSNGNGSYTIEMREIRANIDKSVAHSSWTGDFTLSGEDAGLVYSKCRGKNFKFSGRVDGPSIYVGSDNSVLSLSYYLSGGVYQGRQIISGTQECSFDSYNYDFTQYPSPDVKYVWSNDGKTVSYKIYYNNYVFPND